MSDYIIDVLRRILSVPSPTGYTEQVISLIDKEIRGMGGDFEIKRLKKGALTALLKGKNRSSVVLDAHVDTLGAMVKEIKSDGRLAFVPVGGFLMSAVECENITVHTESGRGISGVILSNSQSVHVYDDARKLERKPANMEVRLDEKCQSEEDVRKLGISVGDFISFDPRVSVTKNGFVKSRFLDDKASAAILLGLMKTFAEEGFVPERDLFFYFNNTEEVGAGAANGIDSNCEEFIAVDMGAPGKGQESDEFTVSICAKDSSGPYDLSLRRDLVAAAQKHKIPYKVDIYPHYGSDASAARRTLLDIRSIVIGPGVDASHAYERTHKESLAATYTLLYHYLKKD